MDVTPWTATHSAADATIRIGVVILTLITAFVHLSLPFTDPVFILNGLAYLMLLAALAVPAHSPARTLPTRGALDADRIRGADDLALGCDREAYPARLLHHGGRSCSGRLAYAPRHQNENPRRVRPIDCL